MLFLIEKNNGASQSLPCYITTPRVHACMATIDGKIGGWSNMLSLVTKNPNLQYLQALREINASWNRGRIPGDTLSEVHHGKTPGDKPSADSHTAGYAHSNSQHTAKSSLAEAGAEEWQ